MSIYDAIILILGNHSLILLTLEIIIALIFLYGAKDINVKYIEKYIEKYSEKYSEKPKSILFSINKIIYNLRCNLKK